MRIIAIIVCVLAVALPVGTGAVLANNEIIDRLSREMIFRQQIDLYLQADACGKRFGGYERTKSKYLAKSKEIARELPDAAVEAIWTAVRTENFRFPPLPPDAQVCEDLGAGIAR